MNRRHFLSTAAASLAAATINPNIALAADAPAKPVRTRWNVRGSAGFDAISFLGPLSGDEFYAKHYAAEIAGFSPRLSKGTTEQIKALKDEAKASDIMLTPFLDVIFSSGQDADIPTLIRAIDGGEMLLRKPFEASPYWDQKEWAWFMGARARLRASLVALDTAKFTDFRRDVFAATEERRLAHLRSFLGRYDVITEQERITGRAFESQIDVVVLHFCKPHGIKVLGQQFLAAADYDDNTLVFMAAHEMMHPPIPMDGHVAKKAIALIEADPLLMRAIREHNPSFGYTTPEGMFNEDLVQALDQIICERLGVARSAARRWTRADDGMHIMAAGLYGLLMRDGYPARGGNIEQWLDTAIDRGWLAPASLHASAATVMGRPADRLWPVPPGSMIA
ncbi:hypothetical protein D3876_04560 [Sphingomonas cavernae]|uniref:Uncharacterized protein n=2 Tax=Sphingomonas cavernae TaxID=2320861 RepID=A0A418WQV3_9SPHN|nr:hypothetical protein D3876_04560 [Sphingomonas cavernae]